MRILITVVSACLALTIAQAAPPKTQKKKKTNAVTAPIKDQSGLPRVLLIGDSISMGYTLPTRALLKGKANVHRPPTNCGPTSKGVAEIDAWLGEGKWDLIHFNWGLHDLKYMNAKGTLVDVKSGRQQIPIDQYAANLDRLVQRMKKTGATLIWRNTTPVPPGSKGRVVGEAQKYNAAALKVMKKHGVAVHDMYAFVMPRMKEIMRPANVHFTSDGSRKLAETVATEILKALKK